MPAEPHTPAPLDSAWQALFSGRVRAAAAAFQDDLNRTGQTNAAAGLFLCAAIVGAEDTAFSLLAMRSEQHRDAGLVLWRATWITVRNNVTEVLQRIEALFNHLPDSAKEMAVLHYARGHTAALTRDWPSAIRHFLRARDAFATDPAWYLACQDETLNTVYLQTSHLLPVETARRFADRPAPAGMTDRPAGGPPLPAVAADSRYLRRFGPEFAGSLAAVMPDQDLLVIAVDARETDIGPMRAAAPTLNILTMTGDSAGSRVRKSALYASWRFLAATDALSRYERPILFFDIDMTFKASPAPMIAAAARNDFCCWVRPDGGPGGIARAAAAAFHPGTGRCMAALLADCLHERFRHEAENLWFVDQVALWQSAVEMQRIAPSFRWGDFSALGRFEDFFDTVEDGNVKQR